MRSVSALVLASALAMPAPAQEAEAYATTYRPSPYGDRANGAGVSIAGFVRIGNIFAPELALSRSQTRMGLRLSFARLWSDDWVGPTSCYPATSAPCTPARAVSSQIDAVQATWVFEPYRSTSTTVEVGGSAISYRYLGERKDQTYGFAADVRASRRITPGGRWWAMVEYARHGRELRIRPADGSSGFRLPRHAFRAGLTYRAALRQTSAPAPER